MATSRHAVFDLSRIEGKWIIETDIEQQDQALVLYSGIDWSYIDVQEEEPVVENFFIEDNVNAIHMAESNPQDQQVITAAQGILDQMQKTMGKAMDQVVCTLWGEFTYANRRRRNQETLF